ncbi:hypothetical protein CS063_02400 [Sporanaerobium hydrogeniformans]|uniref:Uncharacterized protein n=1 Tax=Sporanaerobium hydrogeniformans TaxID=3072179 RepID=A0AC61DHC6_9FIRM|nr:prepilin-type N-terminal cleavage/methylation domain-containing protein [Sporanaerobium hydrogeniformans]PHV72348.1 hypothetical protein CS063_02400 [Sporanaerobium hydrogeniformans]
MEPANQKTNDTGFTLIETVLVLFLSSFLIGALLGGVKQLERARFEAYLKEVQTGILSAQQMATLTGTSYTLYCGSRDIFILKGGVSFYRFPMSRKVEMLPDETTLQRGTFNGSSRSCAGSIVLVHRGLKEKATFTIRVASGKLTLYKEPYKY